MTASPSNVDSASRPTTGRAGTTFVSLAAARAGRECVWVLIAAAFCVVELLVFVTDLPSGKRSPRREPTKSARHVP
jgi:hypothetical protein